MKTDSREGARVTIGCMIGRDDITKRPIYKRLFYIVKKWHIKKNEKYLLPRKILNMHDINTDRIT